jgi:hypothetical protein
MPATISDIQPSVAAEQSDKKGDHLSIKLNAEVGGSVGTTNSDFFAAKKKAVECASKDIPDLQISDDECKALSDGKNGAPLNELKKLEKDQNRNNKGEELKNDLKEKQSGHGGGGAKGSDMVGLASTIPGTEGWREKRPDHTKIDSKYADQDKLDDKYAIMKAAAKMGLGLKDKSEK